MFNGARDQATGLREMFEPLPALSVVPISSARRGMGLRSLVVNLAVGCARAGQRVVVIDAGAAGIAQALGLHIPHDLASLLAGDREFEDVVGQSSEGPYILKAQKGLCEYIDAAGDPEALFLGFRRLEQPFDVAILTGHTDEIAAMTRNQDDLVFVTSPEAEALTATYAEIKRAHADHEQLAFRVLVNRVDTDNEGLVAFKRLATTARKFLGASIEYGGSITRNTAFAMADRGQCSVFGASDASNAARQIAQLVQSMQAWRLGRYALTDALADA